MSASPVEYDPRLRHRTRQAGRPTACRCGGTGRCAACRGLGDLIIDTGQQVLADTTLAFLQSPQFQPFLAAVKQKAREGVIAETKENAWTLLALAAGAGAVGGFVFQGQRGAILGGIVAAYAANRLVRGHG